jgi:hypothetical protein
MYQTGDPGRLGLTLDDTLADIAAADDKHGFNKLFMVGRMMREYADFRIN